MPNSLWGKPKWIIVIVETIAENLGEQLSSIFLRSRSETGKDYTYVEASSSTPAWENWGEGMGFCLLPGLKPENTESEIRQTDTCPSQYKK